MRLIVAHGRGLVLLVLLAIAAAGCDKMGEVASGAGSATKNLANKISGRKPAAPDNTAAAEQANSQSESGTISRPDDDTAGKPGAEPESEAGTEAESEESEAGTETAAAETRTGDFSLVFEMSHQSCSSCGIWFDSAELIVIHSEGELTARQSGSLLIKEAPYSQGRFNADISSIPPSSEIESATLYMLLNRDEGISNDDFTSSIAVYGYVGGSRRYIREITAADDIKGRGFSKANPNVPIDFTAYARRIN
jgi:hypothetical protein